MTKRQNIYLSLSLLLLAIAIGYDYFKVNTTKIDQYQEQIQQSLHVEEAKVNAFLEDKGFIQRISKAV